MAQSAKVELDGQVVELPIVEGSEGEKAIDISKLRAQSGYVTLDNGFGNTGSCKSEITFLDGEEGILRYRGYPIEQLSEDSSFQEVAYLLLKGELPSKSSLQDFKDKISSYSDLPVGVSNIINQFPSDAHPMGVTSATTASLSAFYPQYLNRAKLSEEEKMENIAQILGQVKIILSQFYRRTKGQSTVASNPKLSYAGDFLNMMFNKGENDIPEEIIKAFDTLLILHADHEQNCSASTVRVVGSSKVNLFACVSAGIDALWGQLHGGANQAVLEMLEEIQNGGGNYRKFIDRAKDKEDPFRLMGFGHRVYKKFDPRATIIKSACDSVLEKVGIQDPLLDIAKGLEEVALHDDYFVERKLYPNVDFYSGIIYRALGIPKNMFTCMFVLGRLPGWMAQWKEMRDDENFRIARPRQVYTGQTKRDYVPIDQR